ncbi:MAG: thioredoxin family protein [Desulfobacterales bacterium]|nr:thioredoxin family protein [Desulfobacterales bacterium]
MTSKDKELILKFSNDIPFGTKLDFLLCRDKRNRDFIKFYKELKKITDRFDIRFIQNKKNNLPCIQIGSNIWFYAIPLDQEIKPFMDAITLSLSDKQYPSYGDRLKKITMEAHLKIFIAQQCHFCPSVLAQIIPLVIACNKFIRLEIFDAMLFNEIADIYKVKSVPILFLDETFKWVGKINIDDIIQLIIDRDSDDPTELYLESLIQSNNAYKIADIVIEKNKIFSSFINLLIHDKWPIRLGAMVAFEYLAEKSPMISQKFLNPLWELFPKLDKQIKGDIISIFGMIEGTCSIDKLNIILNTEDDSELRESAEETINLLIEKGSKNG